VKYTLWQMASYERNKKKIKMIPFFCKIFGKKVTVTQKLEEKLVRGE
jgi:hypothetical protein